MGFMAARVARASASEAPVVSWMFWAERASISVSVHPGHTAFTVMPLEATSNASDRVRPRTACFEAQ